MTSTVWGAGGLLVVAVGVFIVGCWLAAFPLHVWLALQAKRRQRSPFAPATRAWLTTWAPRLQRTGRYVWRGAAVALVLGGALCTATGRLELLGLWIGAFLAATGAGFLCWMVGEKFGFYGRAEVADYAPPWRQGEGR